MDQRFHFNFGVRHLPGCQQRYDFPLLILQGIIPMVRTPVLATPNEKDSKLLFAPHQGQTGNGHFRVHLPIKGGQTCQQ
jgi:hypothetical protein